MAVQVQVGSPDLGSNTHESTLEGCKKPFSFQSIEKRWRLLRVIMVQGNCSNHCLLEKYYSGFEESSSSEEHQEASQESDSDPVKAFNIMWKSIHAEEVHLSAEETQKKGAKQEIEGKWEEKKTGLKVQQREHTHLANQVAAEKWKVESVQHVESVVQQETQKSKDKREFIQKVHLRQEKVAVKEDEGAKPEKVYVVHKEAAVKLEEEGAESEEVVQDKDGNEHEGMAYGKVCVVEDAAANWEEEGVEPEKVVPEKAGNANEVTESVKVSVVEDAAGNWQEEGVKPERIDIEAVLKNAQIKVKTAADQGNAEENKKAGQSTQNNGKSQTSNRPRAVANPSNANGGGDNDDDDEGRKPRPSDPTKKKLDCDRPARRKSPSSSEEMEWLTQDRVTPTRPGGGPEGVLPTRQNQQAVRGLYQDSNIQACHNAVVSMPSRSALTTEEVIHGGHPEVYAFVDLCQQLKTRDPDNSHGLHQGVLCHEDLVPVNGQYRQNEAFIVLRKLGQGAFGTAYLLQDRTSGKIFVGKQVSLSRYAPSEPTIWSGLHHESIAKFLGVLLTNSWVIFLSSYLPGSKTLQKLMGQSVLRQGRALMINRQLVGAVDYLRRLNIIHNDIKSDNIVVGEGDRAQLIDFGLSRRLSAPNEASEIDERELYGVDINSSGRTLAHMITGFPRGSQPSEINEFITWLSSYNMHPRVRRFVVQMVSGELTAAQALEIMDRLCSTPDIWRDEPEPEQKDVATGVPQHVPQTPFTRGPPGNSYLLPQRQDIPPAEQPFPETSLSDLYVPGDVEPRRDEKIEMEVDDPDGPETFIEGAFKGQPREVHNGKPSVGPRIMDRPPRFNAANFDLPLNSNPSDAHQNLATSSSKLDTAGLSGESQSKKEWNPTSTAHAGMSGTSTSGFVSNLSGHTRDYQDSASPMDTVPSTSTATSAGHNAVPPSSTHTNGSGEHQGDDAMEM